MVVSLALLLTIVMMLSGCGNSAPSSASGTPSSSEDTPAGTEMQGEAEPGEKPPEAPKAKSVSSCFYVKGSQLFYIDNKNRTPILLVDELYTGSYADTGDVTDCVKNILRQCFHKNYDDLGLVLYCDRSYSGDYLYDDNLAADNLYLKDVSSPDGETIHIADSVDNSLTYLVPDEKAIYYTVCLSDTGIYAETDFQRYRYDIQTGESAPWEQGEFYAGIITGDERCKIWYGFESSQEKDITIYEYASGEKYYYRYMTEDKSVMNLYYWDGSGESMVCEMGHGSFTETACRKRNLIAIENGYSEAIVVVKDKVFALNPLFAEGSQVFEVAFDADGNTGYCTVFQTSQGGDHGLYKFDIGEDSIGPMELIDSDIATVDPATYGARVCWVNGSDAFYMHRDGSLYCNGSLVDASGQINKIFYFYGGELCYAANMATPDGSFSYDMPYTFKAANSHDCRVINDSVIKYRMNKSLWYLGDFDSSSMGVLYLMEDGESTPIESDVYMID